jgi:hypothetical protein
LKEITGPERRRFNRHLEGSDPRAL